MRLNKNDGPAHLRSSGEHTCVLSWAGLKFSCTDSELKVLAQDIARVLYAKGKEFQLYIPK